MGLMGQIIGGSIGYMLGGPIGAILGAVMAGRLTKGVAGQQRQGNQLQVTFFVASFSMLGKMASADGRVSDEETRLVDQFAKAQMKLDDNTRAFAMQIFHKAVASSSTFEQFATQFQDSFSSQPQMPRIMLDMLLRVAMADGSMHSHEEKILLSAIQTFGISREEYARMKEQHCPDTDKHYAVLGCAPDAPMEEVKKKYRQLVRDFHPDTIFSKGLPEEFNEFAKSKFHEIQEAYESIKKTRALA